jgi:hypothetical protein
MVAALARTPNVLSDAPLVRQFEVDNTEPNTAAAARGSSAIGHGGSVTAGNADASSSKSTEELAGNSSATTQTTRSTQVCNIPLLSTL